MKLTKENRALLRMAPYGDISKAIDCLSSHVLHAMEFSSKSYLATLLEDIATLEQIRGLETQKPKNKTKQNKTKEKT